MNAAETIAAMRAEVAAVTAELKHLEASGDLSTVADLAERVERMDAAITTVERERGLA